MIHALDAYDSMSNRTAYSSRDARQPRAQDGDRGLSALTVPFHHQGVRGCQWQQAQRGQQARTDGSSRRLHDERLEIETSVDEMDEEAIVGIAPSLNSRIDGDSFWGAVPFGQ